MEYLGLEGGPPWSHKNDHNSNIKWSYSHFTYQIKPREKIYKGITFFDKIFQPFQNPLNGFSIIQFQTNYMKIEGQESALCFLSLLTKPNLILFTTTNKVSVDFLSYSYLDVSIC